MTTGIEQEVRARSITRLCHFTPSRNLVHIATDNIGILATNRLKEDERGVFTQTDLQRLDQHEHCICCSIEYPNPWYFHKAIKQDRLFQDWVVLLIKPDYLWEHGTRFCPRNASASHGRAILHGTEGFISLYADSVLGAYGRTFRRQLTRLPCCPTDDQAEVLIPDRIRITDILGIVVTNETQAKNELARFRLLGISPTRFRLIIAPALFEKQTLSDYIALGTRPAETIWPIGEADE